MFPNLFQCVYITTCANKVCFNLILDITELKCLRLLTGILLNTFFLSKTPAIVTQSQIYLQVTFNLFVIFLHVATPVVTLFSNARPMENLVHKVPASLNNLFAIPLTVYSNAGEVDTNMYKVSDNNLISVNGISVNSVKTSTQLSVYSHLVDTDDAYFLTINHTIKSREEFGEFVLYLTNALGTTMQKFEITPEGIIFLFNNYPYFVNRNRSDRYILKIAHHYIQNSMYECYLELSGIKPYIQKYLFCNHNKYTKTRRNLNNPTKFGTVKEVTAHAHWKNQGNARMTQH